MKEQKGEKKGRNEEKGQRRNNEREKINETR
jgi:hypothetical protein